MIHERAISEQHQHTCVVTGASSGIGRALAIQLARDGYSIVAVGRDRTRLSELTVEHPRITAVPFDLSRVQEIAGFSAELIARFPGITGLVNNAAIQDNRRIDDASYGDADIANEVAINLVAPIALVRGLLCHLQNQPRAVICNVTTGLAFVPKRTSAVYSASKAGVHLFSEGLRVQLQGSNVRIVEAVMPLVDTPMTAGRGVGKLSPDKAAAAIRIGLWRGPERIYVGKARFLPPLLRFAPRLAARILQRG
jgi:uncharacterized oxidoreductase